jgi:hypothetical protein
MNIKSSPNKTKCETNKRLTFCWHKLTINNRLRSIHRSVFNNKYHVISLNKTAAEDEGPPSSFVISNFPFFDVLCAGVILTLLCLADGEFYIYEHGLSLSLCCFFMAA